VRIRATSPRVSTTGRLARGRAHWTPVTQPTSTPRTARDLPLAQLGRVAEPVIPDEPLDPRQIHPRGSRAHPPELHGLPHSLQESGFCLHEASITPDRTRSRTRRTRTGPPSRTHPSTGCTPWPIEVRVLRRRLTRGRTCECPSPRPDVEEEPDSGVRRNDGSVRCSQPDAEPGRFQTTLKPCTLNTEN